MKYLLLFSFTLLLFSCRPDEMMDDPDPMDNDALFFPNLTGDDWDTTDPDSLSWDTEKLEELMSFHEDNGTRAFIILKDGKIVVEEYFNKNILGVADFERDSKWYWASAGKTLTSTVVGIAQQDGFLDIKLPTSTYLGDGWTSLSQEKEALVTVRNQLTMTTGFEFDGVDINCQDPECFQYRTDAGDQWYYHNGPYTILQDVVASATGSDFEDYMDENLGAKIGLNGDWIPTGDLSVYYSTAREAARFGLLILNNGVWNEEIVINEEYVQEMTTTSQDLNLSYGYLWWLNGKSSFLYPGTTLKVNSSFSPNAPADLFTSAGKNGQFVNVIPSQNLVVIRMGQAPDGDLVPITFHDEMWEKLSAIYQ